MGSALVVRLLQVRGEQVAIVSREQVFAAPLTQLVWRTEKMVSVLRLSWRMMGDWMKE